MSLFLSVNVIDVVVILEGKNNGGVTASFGSSLCNIDLLMFTEDTD